MSTFDEEKTVNLCEDMSPHKHDAKGFQKLSGNEYQKKKSHPLAETKLRPKDKQNFKNSVKSGLYGDEDDDE